MKPFFKPIFKPFFGAALPTRIGPLIGKSMERKMLGEVGGPFGFRKAYIKGPAGDTMLKTRGGMPQFKTVKASSLITVSDGETVVVGGGNIFHTVTVPRGGAYTFTFLDGEYSLGLYFGAYLTDAQLTNEVVITSGPNTSTNGDGRTTATLTVMVPSGVTSFTVEVEVSGGAFNDYTSNDYTLTVSQGDISGFGTGTVNGWCNVNQDDPGWSSRCI